jgi:hypothetical protein
MARNLYPRFRAYDQPLANRRVARTLVVNFVADVYRTVGEQPDLRTCASAGFDAFHIAPAGWMTDGGQRPAYRRRRVRQALVVDVDSWSTDGDRCGIRENSDYTSKGQRQNAHHKKLADCAPTGSELALAVTRHLLDNKACP